MALTWCLCFWLQESLTLAPVNFMSSGICGVLTRQSSTWQFTRGYRSNANKDIQKDSAGHSVKGECVLPDERVRGRCGQGFGRQTATGTLADKGS